jgi:hypothetical protein
LFSALLATAMTGLLGGSPGPTTVISAPAATLAVKLVRPLRSGLFFETHIRVIARRHLAKPVIGVDAPSWRDLTINSHIPAASNEGFRDGQFRFEYPALNAGETLEIKIDGQTNPPLIGLAGAITLLEGDVGLDLAMIFSPVPIAGASLLSLVTLADGRSADEIANGS